MATLSNELNNERNTGGLAGRRRKTDFAPLEKFRVFSGTWLSPLGPLRFPRTVDDFVRVALLAGWLVAAGTVLFAIGSLISGGVAIRGDLMVLVIPAMLLIACLEFVRCRLTRQQDLLLQETLQSHDDALKTLRSEWETVSQQNRIISEVFECGRLNSALTALFRNLIPDALGGFAACFEFRHGRTMLRVVRGVSQESRAGLVLDESLANRLKQTDFAHVTTEELRRTEFVSRLVSGDRRKIRELYLFRIGDSGDPQGIVISTRLFPRSGKSNETMDRGSARQIFRETAEHLLELMRRDVAQYDAQAQSVFPTADGGTVSVVTNSVTNSVTNGESSITSCEFLLKTLRDTISVDRASVYLLDDCADCGAFDSRVVCSSVTVPPGIERIWKSHEATLAEHANDQSLVYFPLKALHPLGVETVISVAVVAGFRTASGRRAKLVVSHRGRWQPSAQDERLIAGCCECLREHLDAAQAEVRITPRPDEADRHNTGFHQCGPVLIINENFDGTELG